MFTDHVIVVLCAGSYSHEVGLVNLVRPLRASSLVAHRLRDVVFYADPPLVDAEWKHIANFPRLFVYPVTIQLCRSTCFSCISLSLAMLAILGYYRAIH